MKNTNEKKKFQHSMMHLFYAMDQSIKI